MTRPAWLDRRSRVVGAALTVGLLVLGAVAVAVLHGSRTPPADARPSRSETSPLPVSGTTTPAGASDTAAVASAGLASVFAQIEAAPAVPPAVSASFPAITGDATRQPLLLGTAFVTELFTRDYHRASRAELLSWAQYESGLYSEHGTPRAVASKLLVYGLTDPSALDTAVTPVPDAGSWLSLGAQQAVTVVSDVRASEDPDWQAKVAAGYTTPDPLQTTVDLSATVTQTTMVAGAPVTSVTSIALTLVEGSGLRGGGYAPQVVAAYTARSVS